MHFVVVQKLEHLEAERKQIETKLNLRGVKTDARDVASPVNDNDVTMTYLSSDGRAYGLNADGIQEWPLKVSEIDALKQVGNQCFFLFVLKQVGNQWSFAL